MENSAYMPTSLASPALMVLASTAEASREAIHVQGTPAFPGQTMDTKEMHIPFSFTMRSLYGQPENFPSIPGHSLHMHNPFLTPGMERGLSFINPTGSGAFRPVSTTADERNGFHSAFLPTTAKGKLDQVTSSYSHSMGSDVIFANSLGRGNSPLCVKEESSDKDTSSSLELQDRLTETPASDLTDATERSTPDEGRSLRRCKKRSLFDGQGCCCPVCGVTLRTGEVELHFIHEAERLHKIGRAIKKSSKDSSPPKASLGGAKKTKDNAANCGDKNSPESRWESYQRVKANRQNRLSARAKGKKRKQADESTTCPVCNERLTGSPEELNHHVEQCLRKRENEGDEDETVDVEGETYEEYEWAGQTRIRATTLLQGGFAASGFQTSTSRSIEDQDIDLNVDVDDTDTYGQPQYNEADIIPCTSDEPDDEERKALRGALIGGLLPNSQKTSNHWLSESDSEPSNSNKKSDTSLDYWNDTSKKSTVASPAESALIIDSLKTQLRELESQNQVNNKFKCLICMNPYVTPLVSVICWHVHCENCWLLSLGAKKLCPQCKSITSPQDLRRLYL